jgi:glycosyltransferase involved in cell wall biosynthesis
MNKVLMISYQFPPDTGSIQRILNFIKYLPEYGWSPIILTHKTEKLISDNIDREFLNKGIYVHRTGKVFDFSTRIVKKIDNTGSRYTKRSRTNTFKNFLLKGIKTFLKKVSNFIIWPDAFAWWIPFALIRAIKIIKKEKITTVYIVTPPHSASIIGYFLKKLFNIKLVIDFRDPWANDIDIVMPTAFHSSCHRFAEKLISKSSNSIITTTDFHSKYFNEKVLYNSFTKAHTITNGIDLQNFKPKYSNQLNDFTIIHAGNFDLTRNPTAFFKAISNINCKYPEIFKHHSIKFFGNFNPIIEKEIEILGLSEIIHQYGLLSYEKVIDEISNSTLLLLVVHNDVNTPKFCIPAKLFEYMATGRPILAISPPGAATEIIEKYHLGQSIEHSNIKGIEQAIMNYYNLFKAGNLKVNLPNQEILNKYDRKELTKELAYILNDFTNLPHTR